MLNDHSIGIVGLGKIGGALASGLARTSVVPAEQIIGSTRHAETAERARERYGIDVLTDNASVVQGKDIVILALKPQTTAEALASIREHVTPEQLIITLSAAVSTTFIEDQLGGEDRHFHVVRAMPNTPCLVGHGMTLLCAGRYAESRHLDLAKEIFSAIGRVAVTDDESHMDAATGLSGSGPAYGYIIIEALAEGGVKAGLPRELATTLAAQAMLGAAAMVLETGEHPAKLKDNVTTPAGTTIDGLLALEEGGLRVSLIKAVHQAAERAKGLSA